MEFPANHQIEEEFENCSQALKAYYSGNLPVSRRQRAKNQKAQEEYTARLERIQKFGTRLNRTLEQQKAHDAYMKSKGVE
tara:strand:- start:1696 stop:1935 length:240 start_codon:yes stop_codon:yes gene_type:complete